MKVGDLVKLKESAWLYNQYKDKYAIVIQCDISQTVIYIAFPCDNKRYFFYDDRLEIISK